LRYSSAAALFLAAASLHGAHAAGEAPAGTGPTPASGSSPLTRAPCSRYDLFKPRTEAVLIQTPSCDRIEPELFGLRAALAEHGMGFSLDVRPQFTYDLGGHRDVAPTRLYNGQAPTYVLGLESKFTYDLTRVGFGGAAQLVVGVTSQSSNTKELNPRFNSFNTFAVHQRFFGGQLELQYGYYDLIREYYGMVLGGNASSAALGPVSVIPVELGLSLFTPSPAMGITVKDASLRWYDRFTVARSASSTHFPSSGFQWDIDHNPSGLELTVPDARLLVVNEFGYKTPFGAAGMATWARVGLIYNASNVERYDQDVGAHAKNNYGAYVAFTKQLTQPAGFGPKGLYLDLKADYAPSNRNLFARDYQVAAFYLGPFDSRPMDMVSIGYSSTQFSGHLRKGLSALGVPVEKSTSALTVSYAAKLGPGIAWINGLTYQKGPAFTPRLPDATLLQSMFNFSF